MDRFRGQRVNKEEGERVLDAEFIVGNMDGEVLPGACTGEDTVKDAGKELGVEMSWRIRCDGNRHKRRRNS